MYLQSQDFSKAFLGILVTVVLVVSVFSAGMVLSSAETEDDEMPILVYKRGIDYETLEAREGFSVKEDYDSFVLVETTEENKLALERQGYPVESLANRDYVGLNSYSFHTSEGEPDIPDELEIKEYSNDEPGYYILQFRGPIKAEWQEELEDRGVILHEFRNRFNYIVEMDPETRGDVEELDFVEWTGIYQPAYRFDKELLERSEPIVVHISLFEGTDAGLIANNVEKFGGYNLYIAEDRNRISLEVNPDDIVNLANLDGIKSITEGNDEFQLFNSRATWVTQTNEEDNRKVTEMGVTGEGELITVGDSGLEVDHEMFADDENPIGDDHRKIQADYVPEGARGDTEEGAMHGTHVAGTVLGESEPYGEYSNHDGNALEARVIFHDYSDDGVSVNPPPDMYEDGYGDVYDMGSKVHTNSWGAGAGDYTEFAAESDLFMWDHKDFNVLFAAGNSGDDPDTVSTQSQAKNTIGVGALEGGAGGGGARGAIDVQQEPQDDVAGFSSRGYAADGRIKPDIMHIGNGVMSADNEDLSGYTDMGGTSMSCPGVAGQVGQVRDYYESGWYPTGSPNEADGFNPSNALVRATLINGAVEISGDGAYLNDMRFPNNDQGFGRSQLDRALYFQGDDRNVEIFDSLEEGIDLQTGDEWDMSFHVDDPSQELEVTLAWTDYPAAAEADPAIVNDLDLELSGPDGTRYVGNAFTDYDPGYSEPNPTDNFWSGPRDGEFDGLNVIQDILLLPDQNDIQAGSYELTVTGHNVPEGPQPFAVVVSGGVEAADPPSIEVTNPTGGETWMPGETQTIEWMTSEGDAPIDSVDLDYSTDDGQSWTGIDTGIVDDSYDWTVPDDPTEHGRIRAIVHDEDGVSGSDVSDAFAIEGEFEESILTIDVEGEGTTDPEPGEHTYQEGMDATVEAIPDDGWHFVEWTGDETGTDPVIDITMDEDKSITAVFEEGPPTVEYDLNINIDGEGTTDPPEGTHTYEEGETVTVTADAADGWEFDQWTGDETGTDPTMQVTMDDHKSITAVFEEVVEYELTIEVEGEGTVDPSEGSHVYDEGEVETLEAEPAEGWTFVEWTGDETGTDPIIEVTMDDDKTVVANFEISEYELTIDVEGEGTVDVDPDQAEYEHGTEVTIQANPAEGWYFAEWSGDETGIADELTVEMDDDMQITAVFEIHEYDLTIDIEGEGSTNPEEGTHTYEHGEEVTIEAIEDIESHYFSEWTGDQESEDEEITIEMDDDMQITAVFEIIEYDLTIIIEGEGSTEPAEGTHTYEHGEEVTLTATPDSNWYFEEWTGDITSTDDVTTIEMDEDKEVEVEFIEEAFFEVEIISYDEEATEGEEFTVEFKVTNTGGSQDTQDVELYLAGELIETDSISLGPGEDYEGEFNLEGEEVGDHELEVRSTDTSDSGVMTIQEEDFMSNYWWLILVLLIGIIIAVVLIAVMSGEDEEEEEEAPYGEPPVQDEAYPQPPTEDTSSGPEASEGAPEKPQNETFAHPSTTDEDTSSGTESSEDTPDEPPKPDDIED